MPYLLWLVSSLEIRSSEERRRENHEKDDVLALARFYRGIASHRGNGSRGRARQQGAWTSGASAEGPRSARSDRSPEDGYPRSLREGEPLPSGSGRPGQQSSRQAHHPDTPPLDN